MMCDAEREPEHDHCERCNDTGWIAVRNSLPMSYVGPGPCPDYATGVCDAPCDRCDRGYENTRKRLGLTRQRQRDACPECGSEDDCLALPELGYCPADRGEHLTREASPYKPVEPDPDAPEYDDELPF